MSSEEKLQENEDWTDNQNLAESSDEEEYITSEELIDSLSTLIQSVKDGKFNPVTKQNIYDDLQEYITGVPKSLDPETVKYLFRGWWISDMIRQATDPTHTPTQLPQEISNCPFCFQNM